MYSIDCVHKVVRIYKKRSPEMSHSSKVLRTFEFFHGFGDTEKTQAKILELLRKFKELLRKIKKKLKLIALASQQSSLSVEIFHVARKTKIQMLTTSLQSLTRIHQGLLKSF